MIELKNDYRTHSFDKDLSNKIFEMTPIKECKFCGTILNPDKARFYQHEEGWNTPTIKEKIWIWFTCPKCGHQWGLNHLGVKRNQMVC